MQQRPRAVPIVAAFLFAATAMAAVVATSLLVPDTPLDHVWELNRRAEAKLRAPGRIAGVMLLAVGVGACSAGVGLLRRKKWASWLALLLFAVNGSGDLVSFIMTGDWWQSLSGAVIAAGFVYSLSRNSVGRYFAQD